MLHIINISTKCIKLKSTTFRIFNQMNQLDKLELNYLYHPPPSFPLICSASKNICLSALYFQSLPSAFDALSMPPYIYIQNQERSILHAGLSRLLRDAAAPHRVPLWWCLDLLRLRYAPSLTLIFNLLQFIFPLWLCITVWLSLMICLPMYLALLTKPHSSLEATGSQTANKEKEALELADV